PHRPDHVARSAALDGHHRQRVIDHRQMKILDLDGRCSSSGLTVLEDEGALLDDESGHLLAGFSLLEQAGEIPAAVATAHRPQSWPVDFYLEDRQFSLEE